MGKQKRSENTYQKIQTVFKRDEKNVIMPYDELTQPEFEFLRSLPWRCEEKIDGTNIRIEVLHAIVGKNDVVGNSVELKNVILFDHVQTPHYNYVGDSILGYYSHMGAGSITSNVKADKKLVIVHNGTEQVETGIKKFGAMLGDHVEVGCNAVCNPGTVIGRNSNVYPTSCVRGVVPADSIYKNSGEIIHKGEM